MSKLFEPVDAKHDGKGRVVYICKSVSGFYVYKPSVGYKSKHWQEQDNEDLQTCFNRMIGCSHNNDFYEPGEKAVEQEDYSVIEEEEPPVEE